ncbi:Calcineurin-like metallo-phosphoesterase superfamily protein, putative isoform 1 [Theobroma cacao]|uniref:Calcineurin-like metallo-phosphoesterase superfamily protein, putative isoform 1 n=1 Tax=Theobroma cacao TaxID=3641 RepID=A0A061FGL1_THECC|nr:Calcineurin-like metallo-phosphoesterase superfamily protein, putative isoform 1 [Theobroma cacao]
MVAVAWRSLLPVIIISAFIVYEERVSFPSCKHLPDTTNHPGEHIGNEDGSPEDLTVMMVANLLLLGSDAGFVNLYFRDYYMSKFFKKSFQSLKPDMLLVLGDVSAKGSELSRSKWLSVFHQFDRILGPFLELPLHVILGDRDVGECCDLDAKSVNWVARNFPGLDSSGCGAFEISNISFVSLNAVPLLCGNNKLRFGVEKVVERKSVDLQMKTKSTAETKDESGMSRELSYGFGWRENAMTSGSGPVLVLHFPLYRPGNTYSREGSAFKSTIHPSGHSSNFVESSNLSGSGPYDLSQTVPPNATEYIFQALKPRIIFSAHTHEFSDHTHPDGTREVTVPAMTWNARVDPGFIVATFRGNISAVSVTYCSVARESDILIVYTCTLVLFIILVIVSNTPQLKDF